MLFPCKDHPDNNGEADWWASLRIRISNPARHSPPSVPFEAMIDTGASRCLFHADIGESLGFNVTAGKQEATIGVSGKPSKVYLHRVSMHVASGIETILAGFIYDLPVAGLLGRRGFLENFKFTYDASTIPPQFDVTKILRA